MRRLSGCLLSLALCVSVSPAATIERALNRMYNFDFKAADGEMDGYIAERPADPLGYTFRAAALLFRELDRLSILEAEFITDNGRILDKKPLSPDVKLKERFMAAVEKAKGAAEAKLAVERDDKQALFALCLGEGLITDYLSLVEKKHFGSLSHARQSHALAVRLLKVDPEFVDAYLTTGVTEYFLGSVPFFVKWFVRFEAAEGDKKLGIERLKTVVERGKYLGPFAKILLAVIDLREKRPQAAETKLAELRRDFPENPLFQKELEKLRSHTR